METGTEIRQFAGHSGPITGLSISPDGDRVATVGDSTVRVWDVSNGQEVLTIYAGRPRSVSFSPDGRRLVTSDDDGIHFYVLNIEELVAIAKARVTRHLNDAECRKYLHVDKCPAAE